MNAYPDTVLTGLRKAPTSELLYTFDWSPWLVSGVITSAEVLVDTGITVTEESLSTTTHVLRVSAGDENTKYRFGSRVTTADGQVETQLAEIAVTQPQPPA